MAEIVYLKWCVSYKKAVFEKFWSLSKHFLILFLTFVPEMGS